MLQLRGFPTEKIRARIPQLQAEAIAMDEAGCYTLASLKRRDAAFYQRQLAAREATGETAAHTTH